MTALSRRARRIESGKNTFRILAVDDATPEPELRRYLSEFAAAGTIDLLVNETNLGFVGTINRALERVLEQATSCYSILTPLCRQASLSDWRTMARSAPNIGTVTPLSNNGDIFSFPSPNDLNPMQSYEQIREHRSGREHCQCW